MKKHGFVIGKFWPPHRGHDHLIKTAKRGCDDLTIMVVGKKGQEPSGYQRFQWVGDAYTDETTKVVYFEQPDSMKDIDPAAWAKVVVPYEPDIVFTSEPTYQAWADQLGAEHRLVDPDRITNSISGTDIRKNPYAYFNYLIDEAKPYYVKRVILVGSESSGKTTLAKQLAQAYQTAWVPEYGRIFYESFAAVPGSENLWKPADLEHIAQMHWLMTERLVRKSTGILFSDTDPLETQGWYYRYYDKTSPLIDKLIKKPDLYLVCEELPFVQDGFRNDPDVATGGRRKLFNALVKLLSEQKMPHVFIRGNEQVRLRTAIEEINKHVLK